MQKIFRMIVQSDIVGPKVQGDVTDEDGGLAEWGDARVKEEPRVGG